MGGSDRRLPPAVSTKKAGASFLNTGETLRARAHILTARSGRFDPADTRVREGRPCGRTASRSTQPRPRRARRQPDKASLGA